MTDNRICEVCGNRDCRPFVEENGFASYQCSNCGLVFVDPKPSLEQVEHIYTHDEAHVSAESLINVEFYKRLNAKRNLSFIRKHVPKGAVLEVGAGGGYFVDEARKLGYQPFAIEFNPTQKKHISDTLNIPCIASTARKGVFGGQEFDVVYHCDVISHFHDPEEELKSTFDLLRPGGILAFETGNIADIDHKYTDMYGALQLPDHLFFFGRRSLDILLKKAGFEIVVYRGSSLLPQYGFLSMWAKLKSLRHRSKPNPAPAQQPAAATPPKPATQNQSAMKKAFDRWLFFLRYDFGAIWPKDTSPQTVIIIARKPT